MKKNKNSIGTMVLIMLVSIFIASCDYFNRPMLDYLEEWTNMAQVSKHTFDDTYPVIGDITNIPSGKDRVITYYLINPQSYDLGIEVTFDPSLGWDPIRTDNHPDYVNTSNQGTVEQDATDKSIIRLTLNKNALAGLDGDGRDISPMVSIVEPRSGRFFGSYTVPVRVNSLPPRLFNAVIMKYRDSNEKYAVCFSLPAMGAGDIHRDITQITVNGTFNGQPFNKTYRVTGGGTETISVEGLETSSISDYEVIGSEFVDMGTTFVGIKTGLDLGPTTPTYTITLTDSSGASTVTTVSTVSTLLNKIYVNENSGDDNNTGTVSSPVKTIGNALEKLRDVPKGNVILQSDISLTGEVTVGSGISVTVTTDGSGRTVTNGAGRVFNITSGGSLILGENITLTGTNAGGSGGAVYVDGGSFTMESGSKITGSSADYGGAVYVDGGTFEMSGGTISGNSSSRNGGGVYVDGTFSVSGSPTITGNTVSNNANNVYLPGGKTITIGDGGLTGGTIGVTAEAITPGDAVRITDTDVTGAADRFVSDISPYSIEETIATTDGGIAVFLSDAEVSYQESSAGARSLGALSDAVSEANTWTSGGTITLMKNIDGNNAVFGTGPITFSGGTGALPIILNLNGKTIDRGLTEAVSDGQVILISNGNVTIKDSSANSDGTGGTGKITGGYNDGDQDNGGGGIYVESGSLTLESGSITGNKTLKDGGGVYVDGGTFTLSGGTISGNSSSRNGGGVYMDGTFSVSGSPTITNNTVSGNANNVYLPGGKTITIGDGGLTGGTIGVSAKAITPGNAVKITDKNVTGAANRFTSDVAGYTIMEGIAPMEDAVYLFGGNIGTDVNIEVVYSSGGKVQFGTFEKARAASATEITLLKDITPTTASGFSWPITFKWTCTLDLNGYAIDRELKSGTNDGQIIVIESSGNLTIKDSSATQPDGTGGTGKITGGYDSGNGQNNGGGGIYIKSGSLTMESGSITGNQTDKFGGGVLIEGGNFSMSGGTISNNTASAGGGGVYVFTDCAFTMLDGTISRNSTTHYASAGGGVYVYTKGVFTMRDGTISENSTAIRGGGVYVINGTYTPEGGRVEDNSPDNVFQESP